MGIKDQLVKLKDNWLLIVLVLVVLIFFGFSGSDSGTYSAVKSASFGGVQEMDMAVDYAPSVGTRGYDGAYYNEDFAPEEEDRLIAKTGNMYTEVENGGFKDAESKLKAILKTSDAFLLNEDVRKYEQGWKEYYTGNYDIKVEAGKYDTVVLQLKEIGEVTSFNENAADVTGSHTKIEVELEVEKERLKRYHEMYEEATEVEDKINLNDRIFNQERTIKYLEERLQNVDRRVEYSTLYLYVSEERSEYASITFVKLSEIVGSFVGSLASLLLLISVLIPYAAAGLGIWFLVRLFKKKKK